MRGSVDCFFVKVPVRSFFSRFWADLTVSEKSTLALLKSPFFVLSKQRSNRADIVVVEKNTLALFQAEVESRRYGSS